MGKLYPKEEFSFVGNKEPIGGREVDFINIKSKIIVLYHGDYWHCNPDIYKADYYHPQIKKIAQEIWDRDKETKGILLKLGYKVIIIWEKDLKDKGHICL